MKVTVDHGNDRRRSHLTNVRKRCRHLFDRLTGVDRNETVRPLDERLIGQPVADQAPDTRSNGPQLASEQLGMRNRIAVRKLTLIGHTGARPVGFEAGRQEVFGQRTLLSTDGD